MYGMRRGGCTSAPVTIGIGIEAGKITAIVVTVVPRLDAAMASKFV